MTTTWLNQRETANLLGFKSVSTVKRLVATGKLRVYRLDETSPWRFRSEDVESLVASSEVQTNAISEAEFERTRPLRELDSERSYHQMKRHRMENGLEL